MKQRVSIYLAAVASLGLASCSLFQGGVKTTGASGATKTEVEQTDEQAAATEANVPSPLLGKMNGEWVIVGVGQNTIVRDANMPYIYFDESDSRFYASNGCNTLNGTYKLSGSNVTFANGLSTLQECPDVAYTSDISKALGDGVTLAANYEHKGQESYIYLRNRSGANVLTLRRHNMETLTGQWIVSEIEGEKINDPELNIFIDIPELKVHGNTGCNYFNGSVLIDPVYPNSISFSQMGVTMRMCEKSDLERKYLVALEQAQSYRLSDANTLLLLNDHGKTVLTLKRDTNISR